MALAIRRMCKACSETHLTIGSGSYLSEEREHTVVWNKLE